MPRLRALAGEAPHRKGVCSSRTIAALAAIVVLFLSNFSFAELADGDRLINNAFLQTSSGSFSTAVSIVFVAAEDDEGDDEDPFPSDILLDCPPQSNCTTPSAVENSLGHVIGLVRFPGTESLDGLSVSVSDERFEINDGVLKLLGDVALNFEGGDEIVLTITVADEDGNSLSQFFQIPVVDVNEAPEALGVDNNYVPAGEPGGVIGTITSTDVDANDTASYEVIGDDRFEIVDGVFKLASGIELGEDQDIPVTISVTDSGGLTAQTVVVVTTNPDNREVAPTPARLSLLAPDFNGENVEFAPASCSPPDSLGAAQPLDLFGPPSLEGPLEVDPADAYAIGDAILVAVEDADQNLRPLARDTLSVRLDVTITGDSETVLLTETGVNTGFFVGYIFSTSRASQIDDCILTVASRAQVTATYTDPTDGSDLISNIAEISPVGLVFDEETGEPVDGVVLTLVRVADGTQAEVRGDGPEYALYPSAVVSGESVQDRTNAVYDHDSGEYRFPAIPAGRYRLEIFNIEEFEFSELPDDDLQLLPRQSSPRSLTISDGTFKLSLASRGQPFELSQGSLPRIDIPVRRVVPDTVPPLSPSRISFHQYTSKPDVGETINVQQSLCVANQARQISELRDTSVPVPGLVNLVETDVIKAGQPVFIIVTDLNRNLDPAVRERITIELTVPATGDREFLKLTETETDSGRFAGYIQSSEGEQDIGSCALGVQKNEPVFTRYADSYDRSDTSAAQVLVDPFGVLFSTLDGELINGVTVTLVNADDGTPAEVFGDGPSFAPYPSTVVTGEGAVDEAGLVYTFGDGGYRFPFVSPGDYRLEISGLPPQYVFPSIADIDLIQQLPDAPYAIRQGSRGRDFEVPVGPALNIDIPVDQPAANLFVSKTPSKQRVAIGDFLQYRISITADVFGPVGETTLVDTLPRGFRYRPGSLKIDGVSAEPEIDASSRVMRVDLPATVADGVELTYVTEVTPGAQPGEAINVATIVGELIASSNTTQARVLVSDDLFSNKAILTGRVTFDECDAASETAEGIPGVRIYLENGAFTTTDEEGFWHFEGVEPGTHVVQLDTASLEERYEPSVCNANSRFAGSKYSQFVDVRGGTVWRADFSVKDRPPPTADVNFTQSVSEDGEKLWVLLEAEVDGDIAIEDAKVLYNAPKGWKLVEGSAELAGAPATREKTIVGSLWEVGNFTTGKALRFALTPMKKAVRDNRMVALQPRFETRSTALTADDKAELERVLAEMGGQRWEEIVVVGHTDNVPIAPQNRVEFENNDMLSLERADSVAMFIRDRIDVERVSIVGAGERYPIASNDTREGRAQNRRVEILFKADETPTIAPEQLVGESTARLMFSSIGSKNVKTETSRVPLQNLAGGFESVSAKVSAEAVGSWDMPVDEALALETRDPNVQGLITVADGGTYSERMIAVRLDLDSRLTPQLLVDGEVIGSDRIGFRQESVDTGKTIYSYIGVDLGEPGAHSITLRGIGPFNNVRFEETANYVMTGELFDVDVVDSTGNVADGTTPVRLKLRMTDRNGVEIQSAQTLLLQSDDLAAYTRDLSLSELAEINDARYVRVGPGGELLLNPVSVSGIYRGVLKYEEQEFDFEIFVEPDKREWIMVGVAEGTAAHQTLSGNMESLKAEGLDDEFSTDGRLAFYAKGQVKGEYVLTVAYDSDKEKRNAVGDQIDPNEYYTLYGDQTQTQYDAESNEKLYLKLEKGQFYTLFGDYSTGLSGAELSTYSRRLTGLKTEFDSDRFEVVAFVSEADQAFIKDEIRGDGTSGLYRLSSSEIIRNSEQVTIETRDRFQTQEIIDAEPLRRFIDYDIDYAAGTLFFKRPIPSQDTAFNPVFIVVDYETPGGGTDRLNAGGRVAYSFAEDSEIGLTMIHEGVENQEADLAAIDVQWQLDDVTEVRAEAAVSRGDRQDRSADGQAFIAEIERRTGNYEATAYARQIDKDFGLDQQSASEQGARKIGVEGRYSPNDSIEVRGEVYEQTELESGAKESVAATSVEMRGERYAVNAGVRSAVSESSSGEKRQSNLLMAGADYQMLDGKLLASVNGDAPIGGKSEVNNFPKRLRVGLDYQLSAGVTLSAQQEFSWGEEIDTQGTRVGIKTQPWRGGEISTSAEQTFDENGERLAAVAGLRQTWEFNDKWRFDFSVDRSETMKKSQAPRATLAEAPPLEVTTVFSSPDNNDFTSVTFGSTYSRDAWDWTTRVEYRTSDKEDRVNLVSDVIHDLDDGKQLLAQVDIQDSDGEDAQRSSADIRLGYAFRPADSRWTLFNRLDLSRSSIVSNGFDTVTQKIVNNLNANFLWTEDTQIALQYGAKYVTDNFDGNEYSGYTDLLGMELRHDLGQKWDLGLHGSLYSSHESDVSDYSYGVSFGYNIARNVWMSLGYNFDGFSDDDFLGSEYTAEGVYLKYRVKFDQDTIRNASRAWFGGDAAGSRD